MTKKLPKIIGICLIVAAVTAGGYLTFQKYKDGKKGENNTKYITSSAIKHDMTVSIQGTGTIFADINKEIVANNSGEIKDLKVKAGDVVKKGQVLCKVDSEQVRQQVSKAETDLEKQKLQLNKAKTDEDIALQNLLIETAQKDLDYANQQSREMTLTSPIDGMVVEVNNNSGDNVQSGKTILSIVDTSSLKVKASVDELDIAKVKKGQKVQITVNAIKDKTYEGVVEFISQKGTNVNGVTTYDVVVSIKDAAGVKLGMGVNVDILVNSKQDVLVVPVEALVDKNGNKYVMIADNTNSNNKELNENIENKQNNLQKGENERNNDKEEQRRAQGSQLKNRNLNLNENSGKLVQVKTGLENENYIEILEGIAEGQKVLITLPQTTNSNMMNNKSGFGNMGGNMNMSGGSKGH